MQNLTIALVVLGIEAVLIGLIGVVYFIARRAGERRAPTEPLQDLKPLANQLVQVHESMMGLYHRFFTAPKGKAETEAPPLDGAESALRRSVVGLRCVAAQVANGRVSAAEIGRDLLDTHELLLTAWREDDRFAPAGIQRPEIWRGARDGDAGQSGRPDDGPGDAPRPEAGRDDP